MALSITPKNYSTAVSQVIGNFPWRVELALCFRADLAGQGEPENRRTAGLLPPVLRCYFLSLAHSCQCRTYRCRAVKKVGYAGAHSPTVPVISARPITA